MFDHELLVATPKPGSRLYTTRNQQRDGLGHDLDPDRQITQQLPIGLGKDAPVEKNNNAKGRAENRRVDVRLLTNNLNSQNAAAIPPAANTQPQQAPPATANPQQ